MAEKEYIERDKIGIGKCNPEVFEDKGYAKGWNDAIDIIQSAPAADVLPRDEGIKLGAELAAMHGATPEQQQLEEAYLKGVEYGMTRRDVRPVVRGKWKPSMRGTANGPIQDKDEWYGPLFLCSECGADMIGATNFCPNCGAMMEES